MKRSDLEMICQGVGDREWELYRAATGWAVVEKGKHGQAVCQTGRDDPQAALLCRAIIALRNESLVEVERLRNRLAALEREREGLRRRMRAARHELARGTPDSEAMREALGVKA